MSKRRKAGGTLTLSTLRQVEALADPIRFRMFERLLEAAHTGKQLAEALGTRPTQLYHHLKVLEGAGLIRRVATRKKRGTTEKYYQAVSNRIAIDPDLFAGRIAARRAVHAQVLRVTAEELVEADEWAHDSPQSAPIVFKRLRLRTTAAKIDALVRQLEKWLAAAESALDGEGEAEYAVTVACYPTRSARAE
jgi:DNA-binding transcriptional ArsR family regulator